MPNQYSPKKIIITPIGPSIAYVPLTKDMYAVIDAWMAEEIGKHSWHASESCNGRFYARRGPGKTKKYMHRELLDDTDLEVDHRNGNTLFNVIGNLRPATSAQNSMNSRKQSKTASGFKGVYWCSLGNNWNAKIKLNGKTYSLGNHSTPELAHAAYCEAATRLHGEFARFA